ncbi:helix-turn-helix domain-containing protein [Legionella oakridgensis]|nr:helix-turn-helix transcriptional regulator [Legionella oakridgensis]
MENSDMTKQFAHRLREALIAAGYQSQRSTSGINIHKLAEMTGYSPQICRKYLRGQAIPEPSKLAEIATKLHVSPGWLLFGDGHHDNHVTNNKITINKNLLRYIFIKADELYHTELSNQEITDFLLDLTYDISQIDTSEEQSKKIINLAFTSARHFSPKTDED